MTVAKYQEILIEPTVWNTYVVAMIGGKRKQWLSLFNRCMVCADDRDDFLNHMDTLIPRGAVTFYSPGTPGNVFVYFPAAPKSRDAQDCGAVAHEMMHVTFKILDRKGLVLARPTEEAFAYLIEFLVREFWAKLKR